MYLFIYFYDEGYTHTEPTSIDLSDTTIIPTIEIVCLYVRKNINF